MDLDAIPFIPAVHSSGPGGRPTLIVLHSMECPMEDGRALGVANWFAGPSSPEASAHYMVDPGNVVCGVQPPNVAWHVGNANWYAGGMSIGIEQSGYAAFTRDDWLSPAGSAQLDRVVDLVRSLCDRYGIPKAWCGVKELQVGAFGITTHGTATAAGIGTDHTDPGPNWPVDEFLKRLVGAPEEDDVKQYILVGNDGTHWNCCGNTRVRLATQAEVDVLKFTGVQVIEGASPAWISSFARIPRDATKKP